MSSKPTGAGKGDSPRSNYSRQFRDNYDAIQWGPPKEVVKSFSETRKKIRAALKKQPKKVTLEEALEQVSKTSIKKEGREVAVRKNGKIVGDEDLNSLDVKTTNHKAPEVNGPKCKADTKNRNGNILDRIRFGSDFAAEIARTEKVMEQLIDGYKKGRKQNYE